jgi:hypothetical protein
MQKATKKQIRDHYKARGYAVSISRDGHVRFRPPGESWKDGRWVQEYWTENDDVCLRRNHPSDLFIM